MIKKLFSSFHYNGSNSYSTEIYKFKAKDSETVAITICLGTTFL